MKKSVRFNNLFLYVIITLEILMIFAIGVYAAQKAAAGGTHNYAEAGIPTCSDKQTLVWGSGEWKCYTIPADKDYCRGGTCEGPISFPV